MKCECICHEGEYYEECEALCDECYRPTDIQDQEKLRKERLANPNPTKGEEQR